MHDRTDRPVRTTAPPRYAWLRRANAAWYRRRFAVSLVCLAMLGLASALSAGSVWPLGETLSISTPRPAEGYAYSAPLSRAGLTSDKEPIDSFLYEIRTDRGLQAFRALDERWGWSLAYLSIRARILAKYPDFPIDRRQLIGPGNTQHPDIRALGGGRYSIWMGSLVYSASDNSSPVTNGRRYELFVPTLKGSTMSALAMWLRFIAFGALALTMVRAMAERRRFQRLVANTAPGVFVTAVMLLLGFGGFEIYQRVVNKAFVDEPWPMRFDPVAGLVFQPHAEIRWSNQLDFWTRERTNSLGFLDREPAMPKPSGRFRVLLVGDSFVEAAQVRNAEKVQSILAVKLDDRLGAGRTDVAAIGLSGTGQANQLGLYEAFGRQLKPDLVVLLAVSNDFADNSSLLSAVRNGWSPANPPWTFFDRDGTGFRRIAPAEDWARHRLTGVDPIAFHAALIQVPGYASRLHGWEGPKPFDMDAMFWRRSLPPAFEEAIALTRRSLEEWRTVAARDGFRLAVVATANLTRGEVDEQSDGTLYLRRFREIADQVGLPFLDLYPIFARQPDRSLGSWRHDQHWSRAGHQWAADALLEYLTGSGFVPTETQAAQRK